MASTTNYNYSTQRTELPEWYTQYIQQIVGRGMGLADQPYQAYEGPRVAPLNQDQLSSFDMVRGLPGVGAPNYAAAGDLLSRSTTAHGQDFAEARDYFNRAGMPVNTDFSGAIQPGVEAMRAAGERNTWGVAQPYIDDASGYLSGAASGSAYGAGMPYIGQATSPTGLASASPYLGMAGTSFPQMASAYMSPYTDAVVNRLGTLAGRNLSENLLPALSDDFIKSGGYGSLRHRDLVGRTVRDLGEYTLGQQAQALEQGYGQAGQLYGQDAGRYAGLAGTAGNLGLGQQNLLLGAGSTLGGLAGADYSRLLGAGQSLGQFGLGLSSAQAADAARALQAGQGIGQLGLSAAQAAAAQAEANRAGYMNAGTARQGLGVSNANIWQNAASGQVALGNTLHGNAGQDASLLNQIGGQQQGQTQQNYDTAYGDWRDQTGYDWQNLGRISNLVNGQSIPTTNTGQSSTTAPGPNTAAQAGGLILGGLATYNALNRSNGGPVYRARGGRITRPKRRSRGLESVSYGMAA